MRAVNNDQMVEVDELVAAIMAAAPQGSTKSNAENIVEVASKFAITMCTAGVFWLITGVSSMEREMSVYRTKMEMTDRSITELKDRLKDFTDKPRFVSDDFSRGITPLVEKIERNSDDYKSLRPVTAGIDRRVGVLEGRYNQLLENQGEIKAQLKQLLKEQ